MNDAVAQLEAILTETKQPASPLRHNQVATYTDEVRRLGGIVEQRDAEGHPGQQWIGGDTGQAKRRIREIAGILEAQAPKRLTGERANRAHALATRVKDEVLTPGLLPRHVMRRNPAGAVGQYQRTEASRPWKHAALTFKRAVRALDPENPDPDLTNLERFRREGGPSDTSSFMSDATIPGFSAMTPLAKERYPFEDPPNSALNQAKRAATANGHGKKTKKPPREKRPASPRQLAALARANAAKAAKRAGEARPVETP